MILAWVQSDARVEDLLAKVAGELDCSQVEAGEVLGRMEALFQTLNRSNMATYVDLSGSPVEYDLITTREVDHEACREDPNWELVGEVTYQKGHRGQV